MTRHNWPSNQSKKLFTCAKSSRINFVIVWSGASYIWKLIFHLGHMYYFHSSMPMEQCFSSSCHVRSRLSSQGQRLLDQRIIAMWYYHQFACLSYLDFNVVNIMFAYSIGLSDFLMIWHNDMATMEAVRYYLIKLQS